jgi:hypothetical protein
MIISIASREYREDIDRYVFGALILAFSISTMHENIISQSVYWLTGSFNYIYPMFMLMLLIFNYYKQKKPNWKIYLLGFFAGATVEQAGMMAFGFLVLNMMHKYFVLKEKLKKEDVLLVSMTLIGLLTVILAPATFLRATVEEQHAETLLELIIYNMQIQGTTFLFSRIMMPIHILNVLAAYIGVKLRMKQQNKLKIGELLIISLGFVSVMGLMYQLISRFAYIQYHIFVWKPFLFFGFIGFGYLLLLCYTAYVIYQYSGLKYNFLPTVLLIIGLGSLMMMLVSPVFGYRNLIFAFFVFILYSLSIIQMEMKYEQLLLIFAGYHWIQFRPFYGMVLVGTYVFVVLIKSVYKSQDKKFFYKDIAIIGIVGLLTLDSFLKIYQGYSANAYVYDENLDKAMNYTKNSEMILEQIKMPMDLYRWVMPYENGYYTPYYNIYIGVENEQKIDWIEKEW